MRVVKSCLLELRQYKDKGIVCQLNLDCPASGRTDLEGERNLHWFEKDHWKAFDEQLKTIVESIPDKLRGGGSFEGKTFALNEEVDVQVRKSATSVKTLLECLGYITFERKDSTLALEFSIRRQPSTKKCVSPKRDTYSPCLGFAENLEYLPEPLSTVNTSADSSCMLYVPSNSVKCDLGSDDPDRYTPTKLQSTPGVSPIYKPRRIRKTNGATVNKEKDIFANSSEDERDNDPSKTIKKHTSSNDPEVKIGQKKEDRDERKHRRHPNKHNKDKRDKGHTSKAQNALSDIQFSDSPTEIIKLSTSQDDSDNIDLKEYVKPKLDKSNKCSEEKYKQDAETKSEAKSRLKHEPTSCKSNEGDAPNKELRRSHRSPVKPIRYEVSAAGSENFKTNKRSKDLMRKCFGSDGSESDDFVEKTPVKLVAPKITTGSAQTSSSSSVKKRKREKKSERTCQQEKQSMGKWLSKKKPEELVKSSKSASKTNKSSRAKETKAAEAAGTMTSTSANIVKRIVYPTPEEIAENERREKAQMRVNENMENILKDLIQVPKKVEILSLNDMSTDEILNTFSKYKHKLDEVFHKLRSKPKVTGYNGINHYSVIELIDNTKQYKMMHKLGEVYEKDTEGTSLYSTLFANALMPEWLVHIFKDKYNFSYNEAVTRLEEQMKWMQYMDVEDQQ
ncbi:uncharacterized protein [Eurosta solidaginis]|uniref:uncharacterized protein n=1 Tax=Eurosta solidaginis TaxID=178769 RepID=UPI003530791D